MKDRTTRRRCLLFALLLILLAAPALTQSTPSPSGIYDVKIRGAHNASVFSMSLEFGPGNKVTVSDPGKIGPAVGTNGAFYFDQDSGLLLMLFFPDHFLKSPKTTFVGRFINGAWQGTMCDQLGTPVGWIAKKKGQPLSSPDNFGPSVGILEKTFSGTDQNAGQAIPLTFEFATAGGGAGIAIRKGASDNVTGRVASNRYPASNEQLLVLGLGGHVVY